MCQKLLSVLLVFSLLALAGCVVAPAPARHRHGRVYKQKVWMRPAPVVVRPGPIVIVP